MSIFGELMKLATFAAMEFLVEDRRCVVLAGIDFFLAIVSIRSDICELPIEERLAGPMSVQAAFCPLALAEVSASSVSFLSVASSSARFA